MTIKLSSTVENIDPFVGPIPFSNDIEDQKRFFGRDFESDEIISLILGHKLSLIYAQSGAGKTSIFNAQITPSIENYNYKVLPIARVGIASDGVEYNKKIENKYGNSEIDKKYPINFYMYNIFQSLKPDIDKESLLDMRLYQFLLEYFPLSIQSSGDNKKIQVLAFDQLEEIFNYYPGNNWRSQRADFFKQISEVLEKISNLKIVFIIREDYLAELDHFSELLPERLRPRFRLERLQRNSAIMAIKDPLKNVKNVLQDYSEKDLDLQINELITELLKMSVENPLTGTTEIIGGLFVEPIQLQVVCQRWWKDLKKGRRLDNSTYFKSIDVDNALKDFYESAIFEVVESSNLKEEQIRRFFQDKMITSSDTRAFVHRKTFNQFFTLNNKTIKDADIDKFFDIFEDSFHLIRREWRSGAQWYEITHDRFIKPIKDSYKCWREKIQKDLEKSQKKIQQRNHNLKIILSISIFSIVIAYMLLALYYHWYPFRQSIDLCKNISTLNVGHTPRSVAIDATEGKVFVTNSDNDTVSIMNCNGLSGDIKPRVENIGVGHGPFNVAIDATEDKVYVTNSVDNTVSVINESTDKVIGPPIHVGNLPTGISIDPTKGKIYVTNTDENTVSVINRNNITDIHVIQVGSQPYNIAIDATEGKVYVTNFGSDTVSVINESTDKVIGQPIHVGHKPFGIAVDIYKGKVYVANTRNDNISVINESTDKVIGQPIHVGKHPSNIVIDITNSKVYVTNQDDNTVSVINDNTDKVIGPPIHVGNLPTGISIDPTKGKVYVTNQDDNTVSVINSNTTNSYFNQTTNVNSKNDYFSYNLVLINEITDKVIGQPIHVGYIPFGIAVDSPKDKVYLTNQNDGTVSVINESTDKVIEQHIPVGKTPKNIAIDAIKGKVFVINSHSDSVSVINESTDKVIEPPIRVGQLPYDIAIDNHKGKIYVTNQNDGTVSVINESTDKVIGQPIHVDNMPTGISIDTTKGKIYVSNQGNDTVSVINESTDKVIEPPINVGRQPNGIAVDIKMHKVYVTNANLQSHIYKGKGEEKFGIGTVSVINESTDKVIGPPIHVGKHPLNIAVDTNSSKMYITNQNDGTVSVINESTDKVIGPPIHVHVLPRNIVIDSKMHRIYT